MTSATARSARLSSWGAPLRRRSLEFCPKPGLNRFDRRSLFHVRSTMSSFPLFAKSLLRHRQIHKSKAAAEDFGRPCSRRERPHGVVLLAPAGRKRDRRAQRKIQPARKGFRDRNGVRSSDKIQSLIETKFRTAELIISHREISKQIDAIHVQPFAPTPLTGKNPSTAAAAWPTPSVSRMTGNKDSGRPLSPLATCNTALPAI